jgi:hypothetical protein
MAAPIDSTAQVPGTHAGGICAACGQLTDRDEPLVRATIRTAAGPATAFLHHWCRADVRWLPPSQREERPY